MTASDTHRAVRDIMRKRKHGETGRDVTQQQEAIVEELEAAIDDPIGDDLLRLVSRRGGIPQIQ